MQQQDLAAAAAWPPPPPPPFFFFFFFYRLASVYGFATQSGGSVTIESSIGTGTTVRMVLPSAAPGGSDHQASTKQSTMST